MSELERGPALLLAAPTTAIGRILRGYQLGRHGAVNAGARLIDHALAELEASTEPDAAGLAWFAAAEAARRSSLWRKANARALRAARVLREVNPFAAGIGVAYASQSLLMSAGVVGATAQLRRLESEMKPVELGLAWSVVECAGGQTQAARGRLRSLSIAVQTGWCARWLRLAELETFLELGALAGASQVDLALASELSGAEQFSEQHLRALTLSLWLATERFLSTPNEDGRSGQVDALRAQCRRLRRAAVAFPLYETWAMQLDAEVVLLGGEAAPTFPGDAALKRLSSPFFEGVLCARQAQRYRHAAERRASGPSRAARKLLGEAGASARAEAFTSTTEVGRGSQIARKSMAMRLNDAAPTDEATLEAVTEVSRYLNTLRGVDELMERILDSIVKLLRADRGALIAQGPDGAKRCVAASGIDPAAVLAANAGISRGVLAEAERTGEAVRADNAQADQRFRDRSSVQVAEIRSVMCTPLRTPLRVLGFLYLDRRFISSSFTDEHLDLLALFAVHAAVAWENAQTYAELQDVNGGLERKVSERTVELRETNTKLEEYIHELTNTRLRLAEVERDALQKELGLAREIQRSILPPETTLHLGGIACAGLVIPASYCGGDFWTAREVGEGKVLVFVGDVTGHGVSAALFTAVLRAALDTLEPSGVLAKPELLMRELNNILFRSGAGQTCASAIACLYDPRQGIEVVSAGHPPALYLSAKGELRIAETGGSALGAAADGTLVVTGFPHEPGAALLLYTDGIVEWQSTEKRTFGLRRLRNAFIQKSQTEAAESIRAIYDDAQAFAGNAECGDDVTLVTIRIASGTGASI